MSGTSSLVSAPWRRRAWLIVCLALATQSLASDPASAICEPTSSQLCFHDGRFLAWVEWADFQGGTGSGNGVALTSDTGSFWFFESSNVELVVKVLDGRSLNGSFWVFYGALSSVEYTLSVLDTSTGQLRTYFNPSGNLGSVADTSAFPGASTAIAESIAPNRAAKAAVLHRPHVAQGWPSTPTGSDSCAPSEFNLCLSGGRFHVSATWEDSQGTRGMAQAVPLTADTGYFWFFDSANVELVLKVLDARAINDTFWVFFGALSDVAYSVFVTDTATGQLHTYHNPLGRLASVADTSAFPATGGQLEGLAISTAAADSLLLRARLHDGTEVDYLGTVAASDTPETLERIVVRSPSGSAALATVDPIVGVSRVVLDSEDSLELAPAAGALQASVSFAGGEAISFSIEAPGVSASAPVDSFALGVASLAASDFLTVRIHAQACGQPLQDAWYSVYDPFAVNPDLGEDPETYTAVQIGAGLYEAGVPIAPRDINVFGNVCRASSALVIQFCNEVGDNPFELARAVTGGCLVAVANTVPLCGACFASCPVLGATIGAGCAATNTVQKPVQQVLDDLCAKAEELDRVLENRDRSLRVRGTGIAGSAVVSIPSAGNSATLEIDLGSDPAICCRDRGGDKDGNGVCDLDETPCGAIQEGQACVTSFRATTPPSSTSTNITTIFCNDGWSESRTSYGDEGIYFGIPGPAYQFNGEWVGLNCSYSPPYSATTEHQFSSGGGVVRLRAIQLEDSPDYKLNSESVATVRYPSGSVSFTLLSESTQYLRSPFTTTFPGESESFECMSQGRSELIGSVDVSGNSPVTMSHYVFTGSEAEFIAELRAAQCR